MGNACPLAGLASTARLGRLATTGMARFSEQFGTVRMMGLTCRRVTPWKLVLTPLTALPRT